MEAETALPPVGGSDLGFSSLPHLTCLPPPTPAPRMAVVLLCFPVCPACAQLAHPLTALWSGAREPWVAPRARPPSCCLRSSPQHRFHVFELEVLAFSSRETLAFSLNLATVFSSIQQGLL